jgi:hypothetical protein
VDYAVDNNRAAQPSETTVVLLTEIRDPLTYTLDIKGKSHLAVGLLFVSGTRTISLPPSIRSIVFRAVSFDVIINI